MAPAADLAETGKVEEKKNPRRRMTQEQIDRLIRYETVHMPEEEVFRRLSIRTKEVMTPAELAYQGNLPVPMGQLDDYIADIFRDINEREARFMRERDRILNDYYTKGYAEEEASSPAVPAPVPVPVGNRHPNPPGRRRFRPGVTKSKQSGKANKMVKAWYNKRPECLLYYFRPEAFRWNRTRP